MDYASIIGQAQSSFAHTNAAPARGGQTLIVVVTNLGPRGAPRSFGDAIHNSTGHAEHPADTFTGRQADEAGRRGDFPLEIGPRGGV